MNQQITALITALHAISGEDLEAVETGELEALEELLDLIGGDVAREILDRSGGVPVNPRLPEDFDGTPNDMRPPSHQRWFNRPYIVTDQHEPESYEAFCDRMAESDMEPLHTREEWDQLQAKLSAGFAERFPGGTRYSVHCLDGGAWDRPTWWGDFDSLDAAMRCARTGPTWR